MIFCEIRDHDKAQQHETVQESKVQDPSILSAIQRGETTEGKAIYSFDVYKSISMFLADATHLPLAH